MNVTDHGFLTLGNTYTKSSLARSRFVALRRFKSFFGVSPTVCSIVWMKLEKDLPSGAHPKHLLWCLSFLKQYAVEHYRRSIFNADEKTIRKWTWIFVNLLASLNVITFESRFEESAPGQTCFVSLDGVDFPILEPFPFSPGWYSHKMNGAGLRYEIGLNIRTGYIVWANGGYPCGLYPDLLLARQSYIYFVRAGERTMADKGYKDEAFFLLPNQGNASLHKQIMARHETVNKRIKEFHVLKQRFRHELAKHPMCFHAVANLTQTKLQNGEPLFNVKI